MELDEDQSTSINIDQLYTYTKWVVSIASLDSQVAFLWVSPMKMGDSTQAGLAPKENSGAASIQEVKLWIKRRVVRDYWPEILHLRYSNPQIEADLETSKFWQKHNRRNILETLFTILLDLIGDP